MWASQADLIVVHAEACETGFNQKGAKAESKDLTSNPGVLDVTTVDQVVYPEVCVRSCCCDEEARIGTVTKWLGAGEASE